MTTAATATTPAAQTASTGLLRRAGVDRWSAEPAIDRVVGQAGTSLKGFQSTPFGCGSFVRATTPPPALPPDPNAE